MRSVEIREFTSQDAESVARLYIQSAEHHAELDPDFYRVPALEAVVAHYQDMAKRIKTESLNCFVAESAEVMVGMVEVRISHPIRLRPCAATTRRRTEESVMPRIVITHNTVDPDNWSKFTSEREEAFEEFFGGGNVVDHIAQDGSNFVAVAADVDDVDAVMAALASPPVELETAMERHGVLPPITVFVEK